MPTPDEAPDTVTPLAPRLRGRAIMHQQWKDVTFLHWRVDPVRVAPMLPPGTRPDVFDGSSWVGLIPFRMVGAGILAGPSVPWLGTFAETNVRLYAVDRAGRRGVVFRSLEASRLPVVLAARVTFGLPYCWARMRVRHHDGDIEYTTRRRWPGPGGPRAAIRVRPEPVIVVDDPLAPLPHRALGPVHAVAAPAPLRAERARDLAVAGCHAAAPGGGPGGRGGAPGCERRRARLRALLGWREHRLRRAHALRRTGAHLTVDNGPRQRLPPNGDQPVTNAGPICPAHP